MTGGAVQARPDITREIAEKALADHGGNWTHAAASLGCSTQTIRRRIGSERSLTRDVAPASPKPRRAPNLTRERAELIEAQTRAAALAPSKWWDWAACADADPAIFHPDSDTDTADEAKRWCRICPVVEHCLADAIEGDDRWGVRGGLTATEREASRTAKRRARAAQARAIQEATA